MIFITGADGFVGKALCKRLTTLCIPYKTLKGDMLNYKSVTKQMKDCDTVVHLAALVNMAEGEKKPFKYFHNNVEGTFSVVQAALKNNVKKFIILSSLSVVYNRRTTYALSKLIQEEIMNTYNNKMIMITFRSASIYDEEHGTIGWILKSKQLKIYGDGKQIRDFIHVFDVVDAIMLGIYWQRGGFRCDIGTGNGISMLELAEMSGKPYEMIPITNPTIDQCFSVANPVPAQELLGFKTKIDFRDFIKKWTWINKLKSEVF